jgi:hypothetical protein
MPTESLRADGPAPLPVVRRARGVHLYDPRGRRLLDLWRDGAVLGHRPAGVLNAAKAALSQGLVIPLPSVPAARLAQHLSRRFPSNPQVLLFASAARARSAAGAEGPADVADPALPPVMRGRRAALWRPFLPVPEGAAVLLPLLPFTVGGSPAAACFAPGEAVPGRGDDVPGFLCAAALRGLTLLDRLGPEALPLPPAPRLAAALDGSRGWSLCGPWIRALFPVTEYARVHAEFLRAGVLLNPAYPGPSLLPGECSPAETSLLADLFARIPGG